MKQIYRTDRLRMKLKRNLFLRRLVFSILLAAGIALPVSVKSDVVRSLSDQEFSVKLAELTQKYDRHVTAPGAEKDPYISERLIVKSFDGSLDPGEYGAIDSIRDREGHYILQFSSGSAAKRAEEKLRKEESVVYAEPDMIFFVPDEASCVLEAQPSSLHASDSSTFRAAEVQANWGTAYSGCDVFADYAGKNASGSVSVAVIDTGLRKTHELFGGRISSGREYDFVHGDRDASDDIGHGTRVAGIIVECTPGLQVQVIPVKALDSSGAGTLSQVQQAIRHIAGRYSNGNYYKYADVINLSFVSEKEYHNSSVLQEELNAAAQAGAVVVLAAGNQGQDASVHPPANLTDSSVPGCIVTASCDQNGKPAISSNYGSSVDLCAPGVSIVTASGSSDVYRDKVSGTSFAAPHVSAAAAMLKLFDPSMSAALVESRLESYVRPLSSTDGRSYGAGILDMTKGVPESYYAESVIAMINSLPASISLADQGAVEAARIAYEGLSEKQKARVTNLSTLTNAENRIKELNPSWNPDPGQHKSASSPYANVSYTVPLKRKQKTQALRVLGLAPSDSVASWTSSDTGRVKVRGNADGTLVVTAGHKTGKAVITANCTGGKKVTFSVRVQKGTVRTKKLSIQTKTLTLKPGETFALAPQVYPVTSTEKVRYTSKKKRVVSVSKSGVLKARSPGTAVIVIRSGKKTTRVRVSVVA